VHQLEVGVVVGVDGAHVAPVALRARLHVLERIGEHLAVGADGLGQHVLAEVVRGALARGIRRQHALQLLGVEHVDAHRGEDGVGAAGQRVRLPRLLGELGHAVPLGGGEHAVVARFARRHLDHAHRDVGALLHVVGDHRAVIHLVDVIAGQHQHVLGAVREDEIDVLVHRIRRAAIPDGSQLLLRRHHLDELPELAAQIAPAVVHVLDQRLRLVLREDRDLADAGVHAVGEHEVDDAELAAEGGGGLGAVLGEIAQALAAAAGHDDREGPAGEAADVATGGSAGGLARHVRYYTLTRPARATPAWRR